MKLIEKFNFIGEFTIKSLDANGKVIDEYNEKNLIMDSARTNMAEIIAGITSVGVPINKFVMGTEGHIGDILTPKVVGSDAFLSTRTDIFSEESNTTFYEMDFDATGANDITVAGTGVLTEAGVAGAGTTGDTVHRIVNNRTVTYTITVDVANANPTNGDTVIVFTEAALYAGTEIFSMKCFPARVKENTVKFEIKWSIIF